MNAGADANCSSYDFAAQFGYVPTDMAGITPQMLFPLVFGGRLEGVEVGVEGRLGVHRYNEAAGHSDDHVRTHLSFSLSYCGLLLEVAVLDHASEFHHSP